MGVLSLSAVGGHYNASRFRGLCAGCLGPMPESLPLPVSLQFLLNQKATAEQISLTALGSLRKMDRFALVLMYRAVDCKEQGDFRNARLVVRFRGVHRS